MIGWKLVIANNPEEAFSWLARQSFDAILLDLNFQPGRADGSEGLACLARVITDDPGACIVVLTAHGGIRTAIRAMQEGARDFLVKPWKNSDLIAKVEAAIDRGRAGPVASSLPPGGGEQSPPRLLGESSAIEHVRALIRQVGPTSAGVAVIGPSGSGRTLAAMAIHAASPNNSEAPTSVDMRSAAAWDDLENLTGTVILRHPEQLGEVEQRQLLDRLVDNVRPIAIVDSLAAVVPALRRRIATVELETPSINERRQDIPLLARHFLRLAAEKFGRPVPDLSEEVAEFLSRSDWPDEVRGLALAMERAVLFSENGSVDKAVLSLGSEPQPAKVNAGEVPAKFDLNASEKALIMAALDEHNQNISQAASSLGISRGTLYRRMERHGL